MLAVQTTQIIRTTYPKFLNPGRATLSRELKYPDGILSLSTGIHKMLIAKGIASVEYKVSSPTNHLHTVLSSVVFLRDSSEQTDLFGRQDTNCYTSRLVYQTGRLVSRSDG